MKYKHVYKTVEQLNKFNICLDPFDLAKDFNIEIKFLEQDDFLRVCKIKDIKKCYDGFTEYKNSKFIMFLNKSVDIPRYRFTLFHELGHIFLGHFSYNVYLSNETKEIEANVFARNMNLPHEVYIDYLNGVEYAINYVMLNVSKAALEIKQKYCKLDKFYCEQFILS